MAEKPESKPIYDVSTHSRLKAAGAAMAAAATTIARFNTQPPEGGWGNVTLAAVASLPVSTHSRLKAAGASWKKHAARALFQHTAA